MFQTEIPIEATRALIRNIAGVILGFAALVGAVIYLWKKIGAPLWLRWKDRLTVERNVAFNQFKIQWILDHNAKPIFILDEKMRCTWTNETLTLALRVDSSDVEGRGWHNLLKESELTRVLAKWKEAYDHQSSYTNVSVFMVGREEKKFLVRAEPFIWRGKVRNYLGKLESLEE